MDRSETLKGQVWELIESAPLSKREYLQFLKELESDIVDHRSAALSDEPRDDDDDDADPADENKTQ